jgi:ABC-type glycerol-3-phosphate transport system substrate-binding protein
MTGLLPVPTGPAGAREVLTIGEWLLFKHNPYPEVAKGLVQYYMEPENLRVVMEEGGGRWGPPYPSMYESAFWKRPAFQHWRVILERGRQFASPGSMNAASGEVLATYVIGRMRRTKKSWRSTPGIRKDRHED